MQNMTVGEFNVVAAARVTGATGASTMAKNCVTARSAAGVYTITLTPGIAEVDATECVTLAVPTTAAFASATVEDTSDTVKTVRTFDAAGAAADANFGVLVCRCSP